MTTLQNYSDRQLLDEIQRRLDGAVAIARSSIIKQLSTTVQPTLTLTMPAPVVAKIGNGKNGNGHKKQRKAKKAKTPVAPLYRDTENAANTWSGRGRQPRWMKGRDKAQFRIHA